jgi:hypothetical protein
MVAFGGHPGAGARRWSRSRRSSETSWPSPYPPASGAFVGSRSSPIPARLRPALTPSARNLVAPGARAAARAGERPALGFCSPTGRDAYSAPGRRQRRHQRRRGAARGHRPARPTQARGYVPAPSRVPPPPPAPPIAAPAAKKTAAPPSPPGPHHRRYPLARRLPAPTALGTTPASAQRRLADRSDRDQAARAGRSKGKARRHQQEAADEAAVPARCPRGQLAKTGRAGLADTIAFSAGSRPDPRAGLHVRDHPPQVGTARPRGALEGFRVILSQGRGARANIPDRSRERSLDSPALSVVPESSVIPGMSREAVHR